MNRQIREKIGKKVRDFYERNPFPGYDGFETPFDLVEKATKGVYARLLDEQLPIGSRILDAGCGTGQLAIFLSLTQREVVGIDFSFNSLAKANAFKKKFHLRNVSFAQMDIFHLGLPAASFDYIFCNGVLHHTTDGYRAFQNLCELLAPRGFITIGLYNTCARLSVDLKKLLSRYADFGWQGSESFCGHGLESPGEEKNKIWLMDQYRNPYERKFTVGAVLKWFERNEIEYINSIPSITSDEHASGIGALFAQHRPGTALGHLLRQFGWIFTGGREGGYFITIGRKLP